MSAEWRKPMGLVRLEEEAKRVEALLKTERAAEPRVSTDPCEWIVTTPQGMTVGKIRKLRENRYQAIPNQGLVVSRPSLEEAAEAALVAWEVHRKRQQDHDHEGEDEGDR